MPLTGAAKTLGTLIEGESLLNDGSAVVLYSWVRNAIGYDYAR
jgi:NhaP-type Na+/H+ or K+/H+ antiporter